MKLGITGFPLTHTQSPKLHKRFLCDAGLRGSYEVLPFDPLRGKREFFNFLDGLAKEGYAGLNITIPLKEWAFEYAMKRGRGPTRGFHGACAKAVKAANTLVFTKRGAECANTDAAGLWTDIDRWLKAKRSEPTGRLKVFVVGTGGSARGAIAGVLMRHPATRLVSGVLVKGRNAAKARALQELLPKSMARRGPEGALVVWCLAPVSKAEAKSIWENLGLAVPERAVYLYDLNYGDRADPTEGLVPASRRRSGKGMLIEQARCSFELWKKRATE